MQQKNIYKYGNEPASRLTTESKIFSTDCTGLHLSAADS